MFPKENRVPPDRNIIISTIRAIPFELRHLKGNAACFFLIFLWMKTMLYPNTIRSHLVTHCTLLSVCDIIATMKIKGPYNI